MSRVKLIVREPPIWSGDCKCFFGRVGGVLLASSENFGKDCICTPGECKVLTRPRLTRNLSVKRYLDMRFDLGTINNRTLIGEIGYTIDIHR